MAKGGIVVSTPGRKRLLKLGLLLENANKMQLVIAKAQAEEAIDLMKVGFRKTTDPYGDKWPKRRGVLRKDGSRGRPPKRTRGKRVMSDTGRMKSSLKVTRVTRVGWQVSVSVDYADHHQRPKKGKGGKLKRERRMMVPDEDLGMPRSWRKGIGLATSDAIHAYIAGQRR